MEENKEVVREFAERVDRGDLSAVEESTTNNFKLHTTGRDVNKEGLKRSTAGSRNAFPDSTITIEGIVAEGDEVSIRATIRGTHKGKLRDIPPTGKSITVARFAMFRLEKGKIAEMWVLGDNLCRYQQLGLLPPTEEIGK